MATDTVQNFLQALEENEELAVQADNAFVTALHAVGRAAGFEFSEDDLRKALDGGEALSDAELDAVAGGLYTNVQPTLGAYANTADGGVYDTVFGGTSSLVGRPTLTRFASFSRNGFSR